MRDGLRSCIPGGWLADSGRRRRGARFATQDFLDRPGEGGLAGRERVHACSAAVADTALDPGVARADVVPRGDGVEVHELHAGLPGRVAHPVAQALADVAERGPVLTAHPRQPVATSPGGQQLGVADEEHARPGSPLSDLLQGRNQCGPDLVDDRTEEIAPVVQPADLVGPAAHGRHPRVETVVVRADAHGDQVGPLRQRIELWWHGHPVPGGLAHAELRGVGAAAGAVPQLLDVQQGRELARVVVAGAEAPAGDIGDRHERCGGERVTQRDVVVVRRSRLFARADGAEEDHEGNGGERGSDAWHKSSKANAHDQEKRRLFRQLFCFYRKYY